MKKRFKKLIIITLIPSVFVLLYLLYALSINLASSTVSTDTPLSFSVLVDESYAKVFKETKTTELLAGEKLQGEFIAKENNLGIIMIRFYNFNSISSDSVIFKIKQKDRKNWYYQNTYAVGQFQPDRYFTFGFPQITDSLGKSYVFEIQSTAGKSGNAIALSSKTPQFAAAYQFSSSQLGSLLTLTRFGYKKLLFALKRIDLIMALDVYLIGLIFIIGWKQQKNILAVIERLVQKVANFLIFCGAWIKKTAFPTILTNTSSTWTKIIFFFCIICKIINKLKFSFTLKHRRYFPFVHILIIFSVALITRISFYLDPENLNNLMFAQIGGYGDYDLLFRHANRFIVNNDLTTQFWSFMNDFPFVIRIFAYFIKSFGFISGLKNIAYFFILLSSLVALMPFFLLSLLKRDFSLGGFIASLFLAINPLAIWLASGRAVDTGTSFFFSVFIFFYLLALTKKKFWLAGLLGIVAFLDGLNRGIMIINDFPALIIFGLFYVVERSFFSRKFPHIRFRLKDFVYGFFPLSVFYSIYSIWCLYFKTRFGVEWFFSPKMLNSTGWIVNHYKPISASIDAGLLHIVSTYVNNYILFLLRFVKAFGLFWFVYAIIGFLLLQSLKYHNKLKKQIFAGLFLLLIIPVFLIIGWNLLPKLGFKYIDPVQGKIPNIDIEDYLQAFLFIGFFLTALLRLGRSFLAVFFSTVIYTILLAYGLGKVFSERHFIQVTISVLLIFGFSIDDLFKQNAGKSKNGKSYSNYLMFLLLMLIIGMNLFNSIKKLGLSLITLKKERKYLQEISRQVPKNGIILVGGKQENLYLISETTNRAVIFNINLTSPLYLFPGKGYFHLPITANNPFKSQSKKYSIDDKLKKDFDIISTFNDIDKFNRYNFYILDYDIDRWEKILTNSQSGHPFILPNIFMLKNVYRNEAGRKLYKLVFIKK